MMEIGAQLYTVRDACGTMEGLAETLKKVADIGYRYIQVSGTCAYDPAWLKAEAAKNGLIPSFTHVDRNLLFKDPEQVAKDHDALGCKYVGLGWFQFAEGDVGTQLAEFDRTVTPIIDTVVANGKYFMYHNHAGELRKYNGKIVLEHLAEMIPPEKMGFTVDTYWVQVGGGDPAQWIERFAGRVPCIHLKDYSYTGSESRMAVVGEGNLNFDRIFEKAEKAGTEYMFVEQDNCYGEDPFDCLKRSYENLRSFGFR